MAKSPDRKRSSRLDRTTEPVAPVPRKRKSIKSVTSPIPETAAALQSTPTGSPGIEQPSPTTSNASSKSNRSAFYQWAESVGRTLEQHPAARLVAVAAAFVGFLAVLATLFSVYLQAVEQTRLAEGLKDEQEFRRQQQLALARTTLFIRSGGDIGKGAAFNFLIQEGILGTALDLSCNAMGVMQDGKCVSPPVYTGLLNGVDMKRIPDGALSGLNLTEAVIRNADFSAKEISGNFDAATIVDSNFSSSKITGTFRGASIQKSRLSDALFVGVLTDLTVENSSLIRAELNGTYENLTIMQSNVSGFSLNYLAGGKKYRISVPGEPKAQEDCAENEFFIEPTTFRINDGTYGTSSPVCMPVESMPFITLDWFWADRPPRLEPVFAFHAISARRRSEKTIVACEYSAEAYERNMRVNILPARSSDEIASALVKVLTSQGRPSFAPASCEPIPLDEARRKYPDRWAPGAGYCADAFEDGFFGNDRTANAVPCIRPE